MRGLAAEAPGAFRVLTKKPMVPKRRDRRHPQGPKREAARRRAPGGQLTD